VCTTRPNSLFIRLFSNFHPRDLSIQSGVCLMTALISTCTSWSILISLAYVKSLGVFEDDSMTEESLSSNITGTGLRNFLNELRSTSSRFLYLYVVYANEENPNLSLFAKLVEDGGNTFGFKQSYYDFYNTYLKGLSKVF